MIWAALLLAGQAAQAAPATSALGAAAPAVDAAEVARASRVGAAIYAYDRAAWVATDAMTARVPRAELTGAGGWVVEPGSDGALVVTFFRGAGTGARAFFTADVRGARVSRAGPVDARPLTPAQAALLRAREAATAEAGRRGYRPCTPAPFNTVVLPSGTTPDGLDVYLLSAQVRNGAWPLGGHYRVTVGADGQVLTARPFTKSCVTPGAGGATREAIAVSHLLDPQPTEIHAFTSLTSGKPVFVMTSGRRLWTVRAGTVDPLPRTLDR